MLWKTGETFPVKTAIINSSTDKSAQNKRYFLSVKIMDEQFNEVYHQTKPTQLKPGPSVNEISFGAFNIPGHYKNRYFFIYVSLHDQAKNEISRSVYWPRTIPQMENDEYYDTFISKPQAWPTLKDGPWLKPVVNKTKTSLDARIISKKHLDNGYTNVLIEIENDGRAPSFMTKLNVLGNKRLFVADDNFFWMQPGEKRQVQVVIKWREKPDKNNSIIVESWNAKKQELKF
jgi:beta-mannosidase